MSKRKRAKIVNALFKAYGEKAEDLLSKLPEDEATALRARYAALVDDYVNTSDYQRFLRNWRNNVATQYLGVSNPFPTAPSGLEAGAIAQPQMSIGSLPPVVIQEQLAPAPNQGPLLALGAGLLALLLVR